MLDCNLLTCCLHLLNISLVFLVVIFYDILLVSQKISPKTKGAVTWKEARRKLSPSSQHNFLAFARRDEEKPRKTEVPLASVSALIRTGHHQSKSSDKFH
jgi:hypothetical protein